KWINGPFDFAFLVQRNSSSFITQLLACAQEPFLCPHLNVQSSRCTSCPLSLRDRVRSPFTRCASNLSAVFPPLKSQSTRVPIHSESFSKTIFNKHLPL